MKTSTFIKRFASVLLAFALMLPTFATAQFAAPNDFSKKSKGEQRDTRHGKKMSPKMIQYQRASISQSEIPSATNLTKQVPKDSYRTPLVVTESGATLYGNLIYAVDWQDYSQVGYHSINPNTGEYSAVGLNEQLMGAGTVVDGIAYISYAETYWGFLLYLATIVFDIETGEILETIEHDLSTFSSYAIDMAYNYAEDAIYAVTYNDDGSALQLCTLDRDSYAYTYVCDLTLPQDLYGMAFDPEGNLYIIGADGIVRTYDITTGQPIDEVASTGFSPAYMQSACWSPADGKILWAASNDTESYIISIDVAAGTSETLCTFNKIEEWVSLYTTDPMASEDAPAEPTLTCQAYSLGSLFYTIEAISPTQSLAGNDLTGTYNFVVELNGEEIYNEDITPGETITLTEELPEGRNTVQAYAINDAGKGVVASKKVYAGNDTPLAVTDLQVSVAEGGAATLTWTAPTGGENDGYVDLSAITYNIERLGEVVATGVTNTTYVDQLPDQMAQYQWSVYAVYDEKVSKPASTEKVLYGEAITLPYEHAFDNAGCLDIYTVVDANQDGKTWSYSDSYQAIYNPYNSNSDADDYAFTPPLQLTNEGAILVEVNAKAYSANYPEILEVTLGTSTDPAAQTVIIPATQIEQTTPQTLRAYITVDEPGTYHIGIHAISLADMFYLLVQDIRVVEGPSFNAPKAVQNVTATPGANGALTATLSFTAPTETFGGDALTGDVTVTAYRNDEVIGTTTCSPGGTGAIVDNNAINGVNNYVLVSSNSAGEGDFYEISCYCGVDIPTPVTNIKFITADDNMSSVMSWDAPTTGAQGGYIDVEELVYTIYVPTSDGYNITPVGETTDLSYEITAEATTLQGYSYYVSAKNVAGESNAYGGSIILGKPYTLPFVEQIEGTTLVNSPWYTYSGGGDSYVGWTLGSTMENYNLPETVTAPDGGMAICYDSWEYADGSCGLLVPKISLAGADAPTLYFSTYHYTTASDINELAVSITTDDDSYEEVFAKKVNDATANGWVEYQISLDEYKDASWIGIMFNANVAATGFVFLDYIIVENAADNDVMVQSVTAPSNITVGEEAEFVANVTNKGSNAASFDITFYVNDEALESFTETELASKESKSYTATFTPVTENLGEIVVKAVVTMTGDEVENNNEATTNVMVSQPYLRVVTDLAGTEEGADNLVLTWSAPTIAPEPIVDDMEKYESFIIDNIGDYTIVDEDQYQTYGIDGVDMPSVNGPKAWQVWAPGDLGITSETWLAYEGDKCLIAFACWDGAASDWLITPEIVGGTEVSFWANIPTNQYGAESFEVLYSTTDTNIESFQSLRQESKNSVGWEKFSYNIPEDAKYFAIRYTSNDIFALLIDNFSYADPSNSSDLSIVGYNVYCDGEQVNDSEVLGTTYNYQLEPNVAYSFNVTVVYNEGESLFSNTVNTDDVSIEDLNDMGINIYGQDDFIKIENVAGRMVSVYTVDGKVVYNAIAADNDVLIPANLGVYVVNIDNNVSCKVFVR